jgi:hypothetical protein
VAGAQAFAHVVVDRDVADRRLQYLAARPGEVPNTTLPPEKAWLTGVTSLDSPPRMLSTHTRSSRVAIWPAS